jgi:Ca2+-binding EF-hand superfamily protein
MKKVLGMEIKTENVFNALENIDEDGDKLISKEEIIAFCNKNPDALEVLGVSSVQEL